MITVLLVDDNSAFRRSVRSLLERKDHIQVIATASNGVDAVDKTRSYGPNVAVMDISMPLMDGIEATEHIRECCLLTRVIILSAFANPEYVRRALEAGAKGYVLKDTTGEDLLEAINAIHRGSHYFSQKISEIAKKYMP